MNKQITEDYVSYEIAVLLKEKGFEQSTINNYAVGDVKVSFYDTLQSRTVNAIYPDGEIIEAFAASKYYLDYTVCGNLISAPTHQMTLKWLREVHKIYIYIKPLEDGNCFSAHLLYNGIDKLIEGGAWGSYESACEAALLYVLKNLI